jgi:hypothetical protein
VSVITPPPEPNYDPECPTGIWRIHRHLDAIDKEIWRLYSDSIPINRNSLDYVELHADAIRCLLNKFGSP